MENIMVRVNSCVRQIADLCITLLYVKCFFSVFFSAQITIYFFSRTHERTVYHYIKKIEKGVKEPQQKKTNPYMINFL